MTDLRIVYMGTPEFAVEPLRAMLEAGYNVLAVVTAPDKPSGRGQRVHSSPVKDFALKNHIPVLQPVRLKDEEFIIQLRSFNPNLHVVVAFRMLPEIVWNLPEHGTINLHASLLPQYRGAAPINHAIMNGETETGLTTFMIEKEIDTGNILLSEIVPIKPSDDAGSLHDQMMLIGGNLLVKTLKMIESENIVHHKQATLINKNSELKNAPKIFKENCRINWDESCEKIHNLVRGLSPAPGAYTTLVNGEGQLKQIKIFKTSWEKIQHSNKTGTIITDNKQELSIITGDGIIRVGEIQPEGKRRMTVDEFLRGVTLKENCYCE